MICWSLHYVQLLITVIISISVERGLWVVPSGIHERGLMHGGAILPTQPLLFLELPTSHQVFFPLYVLKVKIRYFSSNVFWSWFPPLNLSQIVVLPLYHWYQKTIIWKTLSSHPSPVLLSFWQPELFIFKEFC